MGEFLVLLIKVLIGAYIGYGIGFQLSTFKTRGRTLYYHSKEGHYVKCSQGHLALYIVVMSFLWPIYYTKFFRKIYKIPGVW